LLSKSLPIGLKAKLIGLIYTSIRALANSQVESYCYKVIKGQEGE